MSNSIDTSFLNKYNTTDYSSLFNWCFGIRRIDLRERQRSPSFIKGGTEDIRLPDRFRRFVCHAEYNKSDKDLLDQLGRGKRD